MRSFCCMGITWYTACPVVTPFALASRHSWQLSTTNFVSVISFIGRLEFGGWPFLDEFPLAAL